MAEKSLITKSVKRPRGRSTASIIKAAKAAGGASVRFPDGTVITFARDDRSETNDTADEWNGAQPM